MATPETGNAGWPEWARVRRAIVVVDVVESVRLMQANEADVIHRWRQYVNEVRLRLLLQHGGRMVKSLGDGMLLEFEKVPDAVAASLAMQDLMALANQGRFTDDAMWLRIAVHLDDVRVDELDMFGSGVNLAARLCAVAGPGDIVLSTEARDAMVPVLDAEIEDLGECWLKHIDHPVRAFRVLRDPATGVAAPRTAVRARLEQLTASIAVIPLSCHAGAAADAVIGDLVADAVIAQLSRTPELVVLSRLSTTALRGRHMGAVDIDHLAGVRYVLSGSYTVVGSSVVIVVELAEAASRTVIWADRLVCATADLLQQPSPPLDQIAQQTHLAMLDREAQRVGTQALPSLESFSLLYGGIGLLHHSSLHDFARSHDVLAALAERVPRHGSTHAWLAKWHCLRIIRGQAAPSGNDRSQARWHIEQALERDPDSALAWALNGLVQSWVNKDLVETERSCEASLARNPNEPLGWLFLCTLRSWQGRGTEAVAAAERALGLSRLDPMRYYYETLSAAGFLANGEYERAMALCERSLRLNRLHTPTYRVLAIAQVLGGQGDAARATVKALLALQPDCSVAQYLSSYPGGRVAHATRYADALRAAGLPQ